MHHTIVIKSAIVNKLTNNHLKFTNMTKKVETGAAPVSKYAAKKRANAIANSAGENNTAAVDNNNLGTIVTDNSPVENTQQSVRRPRTKINGVPASASNYPEHIVNLSLIIKNNAEIRRFAALGILNYLLQKGEIKGKSRYVNFKYNKFAVSCDGLVREYLYTEPFFINALIAAFSSFSASAQRTINIFCEKEINKGLTDVADTKEVDDIVALNEEHTNGESVSE